MQLNLIEQDIKNKEAFLHRCKNSLLACVMQDNNAATKVEIELLSQEAFLLEDQLEQLYSVAAILREEQGSYDEMLPKA